MERWPAGPGCRRAAGRLAVKEWTCRLAAGEWYGGRDGMDPDGDIVQVTVRTHSFEAST